MPPRTLPLRIAHRGIPRRAPENTLPSFRLALEAGADGLELDVHATRDGVVVIHHDEAIASGQPIRAMSLRELRHHEAAPGVAIPTLEELCALVAGRAVLFVEVKGVAIEGDVLGALSRYAGDVAIHSFDHALIRRIHDRQTAYPLGILFEDRIDDVLDAMARTGASDVWPHWRSVTPDLCALVHGAGGRVIPWTVNRLAEATALAAMGVDGLCGDDITVFER